MKTPTLVVSDPPHGTIDEEALGELLGLDVFVTRLKVRFGAPEIMSATGPEEADDFAAALREAGLSVTVVDGALLGEPPWPSPAGSLVLDQSGLRATVEGDVVLLSPDADVVGVYCRPPSGFSMQATVDVGQAVASGHGPTVAEGIQWMPQLDLYTREEGALRRVSIVPGLLGLDGDDVVGEVSRRFPRLHLDARLAGVRPRARFVMGEAGFNPDNRKRYSYGTLLLCHVLESISPTLRNLSHYEFGSRLAFASSPLGATSG